MTEYLHCENVTKSFGALNAVNNLSFSVSRNEILGITGPNGAGKTTLFEVISGFNPATSGSVVLEGEDISRYPPHKICYLGMMRVFQSTAAFDSLPTWQNVFIGHCFGRRDASLRSLFKVEKEDYEACCRALEKVGLLEKASAPVSALTGLERKFLMIASALVASPKILLLDEPVGGLTDDEIEAVYDLLVGLKKDGATIIVVEHVMRFMVRLADRIMVMHHGELIFDDVPAALAADPTVREVYLGQREADKISADTRVKAISE